jgi:hypothetical protein
MKHLAVAFIFTAFLNPVYLKASDTLTEEEIIIDAQSSPVNEDYIKNSPFFVSTPPLSPVIQKLNRRSEKKIQRREFRFLKRRKKEPVPDPVQNYFQPPVKIEIPENDCTEECTKEKQPSPVTHTTYIHKPLVEVEETITISTPPQVVTPEPKTTPVVKEQPPVMEKAVPTVSREKIQSSPFITESVETPAIRKRRVIIADTPENRTPLPDMETMQKQILKQQKSRWKNEPSIPLEKKKKPVTDDKERQQKMKSIELPKTSMVQPVQNFENYGVAYVPPVDEHDPLGIIGENADCKCQKRTKDELPCCVPETGIGRVTRIQKVLKSIENKYGASVEDRKATAKMSMKEEKKFSTTDDMLLTLDKCKKLAPWIEEGTQRGEQARKLYSSHCFELVDHLAWQYGLDMFYPIHAGYLSTKGMHQKANQYYTSYYQKQPDDFEPNYLLIRNLADLGELEMAEEMFVFYTHNHKQQELQPDQRKKLELLKNRLDTLRKDHS